VTPLSDQQLLQVWEFGLNHSAFETNLFLLSMIHPDIGDSDLLSMSIRERDRRLLNFRKRFFGPLLQNSSDCPACSEKLEWEISVSDLIIEAQQDQTLSIAFDDQTYRFRLPNSQDVLETIYLTDRSKQEEYLLQKCILSTDEYKADSIAEEVKDFILLKMEEADPQSNLDLNLSCPVCNHQWTLTFDIMEYLWIEINERAIQLMRDIYLLAKTFHWSETEILRMNPFRKSLYLSMIKA